MQSGFLSKEKPVDPIPPTELEALFAKTQAEAKRLRAILDPEETPYVSRYEERSVLTALSKQAAANEASSDAASPEARRARTMRALADGQLGRNFMDTEEPGSAQAKLESAIEGLDGVTTEAVAYVEALNNLGVVWCNRGEAQTALELLERARDAHAAAVKAAKQAGNAQEDGDAVRLEDACTLTTYYLAQVYGNLGRRAEAASHVHETMKRQLARRNVSAAADEAARKAAEDVGGAGSSLAFGSETRSEFSFDPNEWARNACDLSKYYTTVCRLDVAEHCLYAAEWVLASQRKADAAARAARAKEQAAAANADAAAVADVSDAGAPAPEKAVNRVFLNGTSDDKAESEASGEAERAARAAKDKAAQQSHGVAEMSEDEAEAVAMVDLAWARMWLGAMKYACELRIRKGEVEEGETDAVEEDDEEKEGRLLGSLSGLSFASLRLPSTNTYLSELPARVSTFEGARELFKLGMARAARAKATLVLDGFVTMHFEVIEVESSLYQQLALWETDLPRRHAMHKRRIELIKPYVPALWRRIARCTAPSCLTLSHLASPCLTLRACASSPCAAAGPPSSSTRRRTHSSCARGSLTSRPLRPRCSRSRPPCTPPTHRRGVTNGLRRR